MLKFHGQLFIEIVCKFSKAVEGEFKKKKRKWKTERNKYKTVHPNMSNHNKLNDQITKLSLKIKPNSYVLFIR